MFALLALRYQETLRFVALPDNTRNNVDMVFVDGCRIDDRLISYDTRH